MTQLAASEREHLIAAINPRVVSAGFHRATPGYRSRTRSLVLPDFDLWYVVAGAGEVCLDGVRHRFGRGDVLTLGPGTVYQSDLTDDADPFHVYFIHLEPFGTPQPELDAALTSAIPLRQSLSHRPETEGLFAGLLGACAARPPEGSLTGRGIALQIMQVLLDETEHSAPPPGGCRHPSVVQARSFIDRGYASPLRLSDIAGAANLSEGHLCALFRQHFGLAPMEYLIQRRLRQARVLLAHGQRVNEVAQQVGFASQHYFSRAFRKHTGMSPREFMLRYAWRRSSP